MAIRIGRASVEQIEHIQSTVAAWFIPSAASGQVDHEASVVPAPTVGHSFANDLPNSSA